MADNSFREPIQRFVSMLLLHLGVVKITKEDEEPFEYTSGNRGNIYIDNRILVSHIAYKKIIAGFMFNIIEMEIPEKVSCVFGGETAGMSFAEQLSDISGLNYFYVRKKAKEHGDKRQKKRSRVVGDLKRLQGNGILIEDLITDGKSKISFLEAIRDHVECRRCIVVVDREQGGSELLKENECILYALTSLKHVIDTALKLRKIKEETYKSVREYLSNPKEWNVSRGYKWQS